MSPASPRPSRPWLASSPFLALPASRNKNRPSAGGGCADLSLSLNWYLRPIEIFRYVDADRSGYLDRDEFKRLGNRFNLNASRKTLDNLFDLVDTDASGTVDYKELKTALKEISRKVSAGIKKS